MNLGMLYKYGDSVVDVWVERLNTGDVNVQRARLFPGKVPTDTAGGCLDVTNGFIALLQVRGGRVGPTEFDASPADLLDHSQGERQYMYYNIGWYVSWLRMLWPFGRRVVSRIESVPDVAWLLVDMTLPGGTEYTAAYMLPHETVVFPPMHTNPMAFTPLSRQIVSARMVFVFRQAHAGEEETTSDSDASTSSDAASGDRESDTEESQDDVLWDFTEGARRLAGPMGDFFGRERVDLRLALVAADSAPNIGTLARGAGTLRTVMCMADGTTVEIGDMSNYVPDAQ